VTPEEALQYLKDKGIDDQLASQLHELVGGRMVDLKLAIGLAKKHKIFEGTCGCGTL
jgi:hypothetical protein